MSERGDRTGFVRVSSDHFVRRIQWLKTKDVLRDQHQVISSYTVEWVVVFFRSKLRK